MLWYFADRIAVLDDNTYTNKTWAEVSGISVMEVHIMEVEFLSNMKYALFTSKQEWSDWQSLLGKFAGFVERATRPVVTSPLPPSYLSSALPSPPASFQASPPFTSSQAPTYSSYMPPVTIPSLGPTPRPSPIGYTSDVVSFNPRKRSLEDDANQSATKRPAINNTVYGHQHAVPNASAQRSYNGQPLAMPRVINPSSSQSGQTAPLYSSATGLQSQQYLPPPQLPPINYAQKTIGGTHASGPWLPSSSVSTPTTQAMQNAMSIHSNYQSRQQSPYLSSTNVSPTNVSLRPASQINTPAQNSPSFMLGQRNSPYKPVRSVNTLLVPPPTRTMHQPEHVGYDQMHYQPLGRPIQERQQGRLPYIAQNQWPEANTNANTPIRQLPPFPRQHYQHK